MRSQHCADSLRALTGGFALALFCGGPALADDTEIFVGQQTGVRPNIVFILDTSGSMNGAVVTQVPYDSGTVYSGSCNSGRVYWRDDTGSPPDCGDDRWFDAAQLTCDAAVQALANSGSYVADRAAQWDTQALRWEEVRSITKDQPVECRADAGVHGETTGDPEVYAFNSGVAGDGWTSDANDQVNWDTAPRDRTYTFYSANWLNWLNDPSNTTTRTRLEVVQEVAANLVGSISGVDVGLMRYSNNGGSGDAQAEGGMVTFPATPVEGARTALADSINANTAAGFTPLSETLFEAQQYFAGRPVFYGIDSQVSPGNPLPSVATSRRVDDPDFYRSPAALSCQKNFVVYLTDGEPTQDNSADDDIVALPNFNSLVSADCDDNGPGRCLDDLAEYMFDADLRADVTGRQNVVTYTVGFGPDVAGSTFLEKVAQRGGGQAFSADDSASLQTVLTNIVNEILRTSTTFAAPTATVNAFNRTETLSDVYMSVFEPSQTYHWPGNLKKYRIQGDEIVDASGVNAVDPNTGFFRGSSRSIWSATSDGSDVELGGAAAELPLNPSQRRLFTFLGNPDLTAPANLVSAANPAISDLLLGLGQPNQPTRNELIDFALGFDVRDEDADGDTNEARLKMGDPLHSQPTVVIYGGTQASPDIDDARVFITTNDGYLHAIDARTGAEEWSFIPATLLDRLVNLYVDGPEASKHYGLDGDIRALKIDVDQNGIVEPGEGDRVWLFFGMRRGGSNYFALDVTRKSSPEHMWTIGPAELPGIGQTWSPAAFTRVEIAGVTQNQDRLALVFGGGYDDTQDNDQGTTIYNTDTLGNRIFMVDAELGTLLWSAGGSGIGSPTLQLNLMNNSIPSAVRVVDLDGDSFGDRMYAADTGGRVWRFDIVIDSDLGAAGVQIPDADELVTGGVFASLGNADLGTRPIASTRKFYQTPDVALVRRRGADPYLNIALGSGWRGHPLNDQIEDRFYSLRDYLPFTKQTQADYNTRTPIADDDLIDITDDIQPSVPVGATGWKLELRLPGGFTGEKVLAESRTLDNVILFPTYLPNAGGGADPCAPTGRNRAYAVSVDDGRPVRDINLDGQTDLTDRYTDIATGGIAPEISVFFRSRQASGGGGSGGGGGGGTGGVLPPVLCTSGAVVLPNLCTRAGTPVRTYWQQTPKP